MPEGTDMWLDWGFEPCGVSLTSEAGRRGYWRLNSVMWIIIHSCPGN